MKYPEYVKRFKPKGTIVKKMGDVFNVYKATSVRVKGCNYPKQVIKGRIGIIDVFGFHPLEKITVEVNDVEVFEYGFTDYLLRFIDIYKDNNSKIGKRNAEKVYKSYICYLSPNSYLTEEDVFTPKQITELFNFSLSQQILAILKIIEIDDIDFLNPLKSIVMIKTNNNYIKPKLKESQKSILKDLGVYNE